MGKLLLLAQWESHPSGSPESARLLAKGFLERGWRVTVVFGHEGRYVQVLRDAGCVVHIIKENHWLSAPRIWRYPKFLASQIMGTLAYFRLIRRIRPTVVYINTIIGPAPAIAGRFHRVPVIWHLREIFTSDGGELRPPKIGGKRLVRYIIESLASHVVSVSRAVNDSVFGHHRPTHLTVVPNGVPNEFFWTPAKAESVNRQDHRLIVGLPGTMRPIKGHQFLIDAAVRVVDRYPNVEFRITGKGNDTYLDSLRTSVSQLGLNQHVRFVGHVSDMRRFISNCDIIVVPSKCDSLPRTVMEAMAGGAALIATRVGGIPEMVDHGINGLLVSYGDTAELATMVLRLIHNSSLRRQLGVAAKDKAALRFKESVCHDTIHSIVNEVHCTTGESGNSG